MFIMKTIFTTDTDAYNIEDIMNDLIEDEVISPTATRDMMDNIIYNRINEYIEMDYDYLKEQLFGICGTFALIGTVQTWNGKHDIQPKVIENINELFKIMSKYDDVTITENNRGKVFIDLYHHDGCNRFELVELSNKGYKSYYETDASRESFMELEELFAKPNYYKNARLHNRIFC